MLTGLLQGHVRQAYDSMRSTAIEAMALIEALIDFGEDEGISEGVFDNGSFSFDFDPPKRQNSATRILTPWFIYDSSREGHLPSRSDLEVPR